MEAKNILGIWQQLTPDWSRNDYGVRWNPKIEDDGKGHDPLSNEFFNGINTKEDGAYGTEDDANVHCIRN